MIGPRDSSMILCAVQAGANDYLDEKSDLASGLAATIDRISASIQKRAPLGQFTTVVAASGGSGRTLVATNLAVSLAKSHGRCGLFDLDNRGSDVATLLGLKPRHTIADLCRSIEKLDQRMWEQSLLDHETAVSVLAGPQTWDEARHVTVERIQKIVRFGRSLLPHVVGDLDSTWLDKSADSSGKHDDPALVSSRFCSGSQRKSRSAIPEQNWRREQQGATDCYPARGEQEHRTGPG